MLTKVWGLLLEIILSMSLNYPTFFGKFYKREGGCSREFLTYMVIACKIWVFIPITAFLNQAVV
jgi:hypothetical protein